MRSEVAPPGDEGIAIFWWLTGLTAGFGFGFATGVIVA